MASNDEQTVATPTSATPPTCVVGARVTPAVRDWLDAYAAQLLADALGAHVTRSAAIKACFDLTSTALTPARMDALRALRRRLDAPLDEVLARVLDAGLAAVERGAPQDAR